MWGGGKIKLGSQYCTLLEELYVNFEFVSAKTKFIHVDCFAKNLLVLAEISSNLTKSSWSWAQYWKPLYVILTPKQLSKTFDLIIRLVAFSLRYKWLPEVLRLPVIYWTARFSLLTNMETTNYPSSSSKQLKNTLQTEFYGGSSLLVTGSREPVLG